MALDFGSVKDAGLRQRLEGIQTSMALTAGQVDDLRRAAREGLRDSEEYRRLTGALEIRKGVQ